MLSSVKKKFLYTRFERRFGPIKTFPSSFFCFLVFTLMQLFLGSFVVKRIFPCHYFFFSFGRNSLVKKLYVFSEMSN